MLIDTCDPVVRWAAERSRLLRIEYENIGNLLASYALTFDCVRTVPAQLPQPLLGHFPMLETEDCGCDLCADWAFRREELRRSEAFVPEGHRYHTCDCRCCSFVKRLWLNHKAAENRRDLLIGASFHAFHNSMHGDRVMNWFVTDISLPDRTVNWWALEGGRYPLSRWLRRCEVQLSPVVSGAVFNGIEL